MLKEGAMMAQHLRRKIAVLILLIGIGLLVYPRIAQALYSWRANQLIRTFEQGISASPDSHTSEKFNDLYLAMQAYNREIYSNSQKDLKDAFSYQQASFNLEEWGLDEKIAGSLAIPRLNIKLPIYLGATEENLHKGTGHLSQTSLPIGGVNTNCVLAAHRDMSTAEMFRNIDTLQPGDTLTLTNIWQTLTYQVVQTQVIHPADIKAILIQEGRDLVTLVSCHPQGQNYLRYVVYCERVIPE